VLRFAGNRVVARAASRHSDVWDVPVARVENYAQSTEVRAMLPFPVPSSLDDARAFLTARRIAVVGVSRNEKDFSRVIFRELIRRGYDVVPVSRYLGVAEGRRAAATIREVVPAPDAALLIVPPREAEHVVCDCIAAGVRRIWFHRGSGNGCASSAALALCQANGVAVVQGLCPFMALPHTGFPHRVHRFLRHAFA
jgi:predicted CoA-binding protein